MGSGDVAFGYVTTTITVASPDESEADEALRQVERVVNGKGFVTIRETFNAVEAWLGSLPGNPYANVRQPVIHTLNLAHIMPVSSVWAGPAWNEHLDQPPLLHAATRGSTPFRLNLHVGDVGHTLIVGPTGAGKSVLARASRLAVPALREFAGLHLRQGQVSACRCIDDGWDRD